MTIKDLSKYLQEQYIMMDTDNKWYHGFKQTLNQMGHDQNQEKLLFYDSDKTTPNLINNDDKIDTIQKDSYNTIIFQLNPNHNAFKHILRN